MLAPGKSCDFYLHWKRQKADTHTHTLQKALKFPSRHRKIQSVFVKEMAFIINLNLESKGMFTANGK